MMQFTTFGSPYTMGYTMEVECPVRAQWPFGPIVYTMAAEQMNSAVRGTFTSLKDRLGWPLSKGKAHFFLKCKLSY